MKHAFHALVLTLILCPAFGEDVPADLERLNEQRARKVSDIDKIYKSHLETLKIKYTKAGDLDAANQVAAILERMDPQEEPEEETRWEWGSGGELVLRPNGVATHTIWRKNGKWRMEDDGSIHLESDSGRAFTLRLEGNVGHVLGLRDGKRTTIKRKEKD